MQKVKAERTDVIIREDRGNGECTEEKASVACIEARMVSL